MRVHNARSQYIRWLRVARDLSPHTIRAYDGDIGTFERHVGMHAHVGRLAAFLSLRTAGDGRSRSWKTSNADRRHRKSVGGVAMVAE
jgi:site-specific recombinase XerD